MEYPNFEKQTHNYFIKDILSDLPRLNPGEEINIGEYKSDPTDYLKKSQIRTNGSPLIQHTTRPINEHDREIYKIAIEKWNDEKQRLQYYDLPSRLKSHKNQKSFTDRFKVVADDLRVSHTLVAHISKDGHYYIHPDKTQLRSISVREAARIQSFPDDFKFEGPRTSQLAQIGNAVPPLMAECIAKKVREMLS